MSAAPFTLTLWTAAPDLAARADAAGVERIGVDLERHGKRERQAGRRSWISTHTEADLVAVAAVLRRAQLFVRLDSLHDGTPAQVERVLAIGAKVLMLPMTRCAGDVATLLDLVGGRARVVPLLECAGGLAALAELDTLGVDEAYVGPNDLALSLGAANRFTVLAGDELARAARDAQRASVRLGVGGLGRAGDEQLPIPSRLIYAQHARLGSSGALLSRSFSNDGSTDVATEVTAARAEIDRWRRAAPAELEDARRELLDCAALAAVG